VRRASVKRGRQNRRRVTLLGRGLQVLLATGTAVGATLANPGVASADLNLVNEMTCRYDNQTYNVCLLISDAGDSQSWNIHAGIDVYMSQQEAQRLAAQPYNFFAYVVASDPFYDNTLFSLPASQIGVGPTGIGADFDRNVLAEALNEDAYPESDEIYVLIKLYDAQTDSYRTWKTNIVTNNFH